MVTPNNGKNLWTTCGKSVEYAQRDLKADYMIGKFRE
jgi:hypothetical protein